MAMFSTILMNDGTEVNPDLIFKSYLCIFASFRAESSLESKC